MTRGWTETDGLIGCAAIAAIATSALAGSYGGVAGALLVALTLATLILSAPAGPFLGIVVGAAAGAASLNADQAVPALAGQAINERIALVVAYVITGWLVGFAASTTRTTRRRAAEAVQLVGAHDSLGLLGADAGWEVLASELDRALRHDRPLSVITLDSSLDAGDRESTQAAERALARAVENCVAMGDIAFALSPASFVLVTPEATPHHAQARVDLLRSIVLESSYMPRHGRRERTLVLTAGPVRIGVCSRPELDTLATAERIVEHARSQAGTLQGRQQSAERAA